MSEKPKKPGRGRPPKHAEAVGESGRTGKPLGIRIDPSIRAAVPKFIHAFHLKHKVRLNLTGTVEMALTKLFEEWGIPIEGGEPPADPAK